MLLDAFIKLLQETRGTFRQERTFLRSTRLMFCGLLAMGRRCITRMISVAGRDQQDWSADYRLFSRAHWNADDLFQTTIEHSVEMSKERYIAVAVDETKVCRTGKRVRAASWMRDPMSPPFHTNFIWGLRFLHFAVLLPLYRIKDTGPRGIPVRFNHVPVVKKPRKNASDKELEAYKQRKKLYNLSTYAVQEFKSLREAYDKAGAKDKILIIAADNSFCNRTTMRADLDRIVLVARARKDSVLCWPSKEPRRVYSRLTFTPEYVRKDGRTPWRTVRIYHGGKWREVRYKERKNVLWQRGAARKRLRLIVLAPTPYRTTKKGKLYYREPAYLLATDNDVPTDLLIQSYFDRWQIEVNHRDEKEILGVGEAQVWSPKSVPRQPAFVVASYGLLLLAGLFAYGPSRTDVYEPLPKWRRKAKRPSCLDLVIQLRKEAIAHPKKLDALGIQLFKDNLVKKASA